jgi:nitrous oxide reductase accessory protein NosL
MKARAASRLSSALIPLACSLLWACGAPPDEDGGLRHEPQDLAGQECAVCGMTARLQSAPRAQAIHRDGSQLFFCSIGDLLVHRSAPSPHGKVVAIFVESMQASEEPGLSHVDPHPWIAAAEATFVVGIERPGIMGKPVLVYRDVAEAESIVGAHPGSRALDLAGLERWWQTENEGG